MKKTNNLGFMGFLGFIGFLGARASSHPQLAYLSLSSFGTFLAFLPTLEVSKAKSVLHPTRKWFMLSLFSLCFLFTLFTPRPELSGWSFLSFLTFFATTKPSQEQKPIADVEPEN